MGRGRLRFPTTPRQLRGLDKSLHANRVMITCDRGGRRLAFAGYKYGTTRALPVHLSLHLSSPPWPRRGGSRLRRRGKPTRLSRPLLRPSAVEGAPGSIPWPPRPFPTV